MKLFPEKNEPLMAKTLFYWDGGSYNTGGGSRATRLVPVTTVHRSSLRLPPNTCVQSTSQTPATVQGARGDSKQRQSLILVRTR